MNSRFLHRFIVPRDGIDLPCREDLNHLLTRKRTKPEIASSFIVHRSSFIVHVHRSSFIVHRSSFIIFFMFDVFGRILTPPLEPAHAKRTNRNARTPPFGVRS